MQLQNVDMNKLKLIHEVLQRAELEISGIFGKDIKVFVQSLMPMRLPITTADKVAVIKKLSADAFDVTVPQIDSKFRKREVCEARHLARLLMVDLMDLDYIAIGNKTGNADRSTVHHSVREYRSWMEVTPAFAKKYNDAKLLFQNLENFDQ